MTHLRESASVEKYPSVFHKTLCMAAPRDDFEGDNICLTYWVVFFNSHVHFYQKIVSIQFLTK